MVEWESGEGCGSAGENVVEWVMYCTIECYEFPEDVDGYHVWEAEPIGLRDGNPEDFLCYIGQHLSNEIDAVRLFNEHLARCGDFHARYIHLQPAHLPYDEQLNIFRLPEEFKK